MTAATLTDVQRRILGVLNEDAEAMYNEFYAGFGDLTFTPTLAQELRALKRRGLVASEGRGKWAQWYITDAGTAALS